MSEVLIEMRRPGEVAEPLTVKDPGNAQIVYFDGAPNFGLSYGVISITLAASRNLAEDGRITSDVIATAFLRCSLNAALDLRNALDRALLLAAETGETLN